MLLTYRPFCADVHHGLVLGGRLLRGVVGERQPHVHALLQQGRDEHHDDEQHQHDVDQGGDVDVGLDAALPAPQVH